MGKTSCFNPRGIKLPEGFIDWKGDYVEEINVPCNVCENCIRRRRMEWSFRMEEELRFSKCAWFVTLTYEKVSYDKYGNMILVPDDLKNYFKRLRINEERNLKYLKKGFYWKKVKGQKSEKVLVYPTYENLYNNLLGEKMSYFACGEYGEQFGRPHYHAIIFNASRKFIVESWGLGHVHCKKAVPESIAYCLKYLDKWKNKKQDWKKVKEFNRSSEGLGISYANRMKEFHRSNLDINYCINDRGIMIPMPRYFRLKMFDNNQLIEQREIIHNTIEEERIKRIEKLGLEEYNRRELDRQHYIKRNFSKGVKPREM